MNNKKQPHSKHPSPKGEFDANFENLELKQMWDLSKTASYDSVVNSDEIEDALYKVHQKIGRGENPKTLKALPELFWIKGRYLVAAIALIVLAVSFFFIPKTISVPYGEMATIELPDGSSVELNSGTWIRYDRFFGMTHRDITLNGEAFFDVQADETPFIVTANGTVTEVTGTRFNIRSWQDDLHNQTTVTVSEGGVNFYPIEFSDLRVRLTPGNISQWNSTLKAPAQPGSTTLSDVAAWRENRLVFKEQPLSTILNELERRFDTEINLEIPGAEMETLTAYYTNPAGVHAVLEDISLVKGFRYSETSNGYRIFK